VEGLGKQPLTPSPVHTYSCPPGVFASCPRIEIVFFDVPSTFLCSFGRLPHYHPSSITINRSGNEEEAPTIIINRSGNEEEASREPAAAQDRQRRAGSRARQHAIHNRRPGNQVQDHQCHSGTILYFSISLFLDRLDRMRMFSVYLFSILKYEVPHKASAVSPLLAC
jgi:hypothetical protein